MATFEHFYKSLSPNSQVRGKEFENFVKWFLKTDNLWRRQVKEVWLWDEHPQRDEWGPDCGIDLVLEHVNGGFWAIQAKCFDPKNSIRKEHMDSFIADASDSRFKGKLLVTSTNNIGPNVDRLLTRHKVVRILLDDLINSDIEYPDNPNKYKDIKIFDTPKPYPHQEKAIKKVVNELKKVDKGQVIMACGTGKTLTSLWIKEELEAKNVLVLLPSLSLLSQTLREWNKGAKTSFKWICVCSDKSVAKDDKSKDEWIINTSELGIPVTSSTEDIKKFITEKGSKIIFSTYQSSFLIASLQEDKNIPKFDLVIADEAHRCVGRISNSFGNILDDQKIRTRKKLFFTATPKLLSTQIKRKAGEHEINVASMDDEEIFGEVLYKLNFSDALNNDPPLLTDYQVVVVGIDDPQILKIITNRKLLTTDGENVFDSESLASKIALIKSLKDYDLKRVITFHGRVKGASDFAKGLRQISEIVPDQDKPKGPIFCEYVEGKMKTSERNAKLKRLKNTDSGARRVLSNARCLSEGVDVPTLDGVAFIDPKRSQVDIIQAVGRAIRKSKDKKVGTIILPVYLGDLNDADEEIFLSRFKDIWKIILALKSQDDSLMETIDKLRIELGKRSASGSKGNEGLIKVIFDIPEKITKRFSESLYTVLIRETSDEWLENYGKLKKFLIENDNNYPNSESKLGIWVGNQRNSKKTDNLRKDREDLLNEINFIWDFLDHVWNRNYELMADIYKKQGYSHIPYDLIVNGIKLGSWQAELRKDRKTLTPERLEKLEKIGFIFNVAEERWYRRFKELTIFLKENEKYPQYQTTLGRWVNGQRTKIRKGSLDKKKLELLKSINFIVNPYEEFWKKSILELAIFIKENGHSSPPRKTSIGDWVPHLRVDYKRGLLSSEKIKELKSIGFIFEHIDQDWKENFNKLRNYLKKNNGKTPPSGSKLNNWSNTQRYNYKRGKLIKEYIDLLNSINFSWERDDDGIWEKRYFELKGFLKSNNNKLPIYNSSLGLWISRQRKRFKENNLDENKIKLLLEIGIDLKPLANSWEKQYENIKEYEIKNGHSSPPIRTKIGAWVSQQRTNYKKNLLSKERIIKLNKLKPWRWRIK